VIAAADALIMKTPGEFSHLLTQLRVRPGLAVLKNGKILRSFLVSQVVD